MACIPLLMMSCGSTDTLNSETATTTTVEESANWVYGDTGDPVVDSLNVFVAPFVQPVCDTLRQWKPPAETTKKEFDDFAKQVAALKDMIGSPSKPTFRDTYWTIYSLAEEALDYERRHPNDKYSAFTASFGPRECDRLNFTTANSKFGVDVTDPAASSESTTAPSSETNSPLEEPKKTDTTQAPANSAVMLSSANITRLKQECRRHEACLFNYDWFVAYINDNKDYLFTTSKACMSYFRDAMDAMAVTYEKDFQDWEVMNQDRCFVMED